MSLFSVSEVSVGWRGRMACTQTQSFHDKFLKLSFPLLDEVVVPLKALSLFLSGLGASAHTWAGGGPHSAPSAV